MKKVMYTLIITLALMILGSTTVPAASTRWTCAVPGCHNKAAEGSYCRSHTCVKSGCTNKRNGESCYCSKHQPKSSSSQKSSSSSRKTTSSYSSHKSTHHTSSHSSSSYQMPDCDDYEDYDEFMDDWEGNMPDGSDAEDYWENW